MDDGHGDDDLLHLVVEIKGYREFDAMLARVGDASTAVSA